MISCALNQLLTDDSIAMAAILLDTYLEKFSDPSSIYNNRQRTETQLRNSGNLSPSEASVVVTRNRSKISRGVRP